LDHTCQECLKTTAPTAARPLLLLLLLVLDQPLLLLLVLLLDLLLLLLVGSVKASISTACTPWPAVQCHLLLLLLLLLLLKVLLLERQKVLQCRLLPLTERPLVA
jgi:hypothetical protein